MSEVAPELPPGPNEGRVVGIEHGYSANMTKKGSPFPCHECDAPIWVIETHTYVHIIMDRHLDWEDWQHARVRFCDGDCFSQWMRRGFSQ